MAANRFLRSFLASALLSAATASAAIAIENKTYTFSGTSDLSCQDFVCSDFLVSVQSVEITGGSPQWSKVANSETSSNKKPGTLTDCVYPDVGSVSVEFIDLGSINANDRARVTLVSTATKMVLGVPRTCKQTQVVDISGATPAAVVVNFDTKQLVPVAGPEVILALAALMGLAGVVLLARRRRSQLAGI